MSNSKQFPLTLFIPIKEDYVKALRDQLKELPDGEGALSTTRLVHFARLFVFEENNSRPVDELESIRGVGAVGVTYG